MDPKYKRLLNLDGELLNEALSKLVANNEVITIHDIKFKTIAKMYEGITLYREQCILADKEIKMMMLCLKKEFIKQMDQTLLGISAPDNLLNNSVTPIFKLLGDNLDKIV